MYDPDSPTPDETSYRDFLLAWCQYHANLKQEAQWLRDKATTVEERAAGGMRRKANILTEQRKAVLWILFRRKDKLREFFGTDDPDIIASSFRVTGEEDHLRHMEHIPVRFLGLKKRDPESNDYLPKAVNWRLAGLGIEL